jgi:AbrB family looped-hinge helix DNA binding protein
MATVFVSSEGQITIPKAIREQLNLKPGTQVEIDIQDKQLVMKRVGPEILPDWRTMEGMIKAGPSLTEALEEEHREELALEDEKLGRL